MNSQAHNTSSSISGNDSIKIAVDSNATHSTVTNPANVEISTSVFDYPNYWVNYLETTIGPELQQDEISNDVINEMESNPTFWVDYLQNTVKGELVLQQGSY